MKHNYILSIHSGGHDSAAAIFKGYKLIAAISRERLTRRKGDGQFPSECIDELLSIAGIERSDINHVVLSRSLYSAQYLRLPLKKYLPYRLSFKLNKKKIFLTKIMTKKKTLRAHKVFKKRLFLKKNGLPETANIFFSNHHFSHALSALFYTDWNNILLYTADAGGDNVQYSMRIFKDDRLECLYGDDEHLLAPRSIDSLGLAYMFATHALGFTPNRHEGKLTGLAAFGQPVAYNCIAKHFKVLDSGRITSDFCDYESMKSLIFSLAEKHSKEDIAASIQKVLEDHVCESVQRIIKRHNVNRLALAGGVFANVRLNQALYERTDIKEIFIYPGMGDEGLAVGGALEYLLQKDGLKAFAKQRHQIKNVYLGKDYTASIDSTLEKHPSIQKINGDPKKLAAELLAAHKIGAIYTGRMEFGPRALGSRSILANPANTELNDSLNKRLNRTEFMPFAPYVLKEDARDVFDITDGNSYACRFMTITVQVKEHWRKKIPSVVHIDNTARPQIVEKEDNPLYYSILSEFKKKTGLPVLVNTSFNAHEEPIINTPEECLRALVDKRVDFIVTQNAIFQCQ